VDEGALSLLEHAYMLQAPECSPWRRPLIRLYTHVNERERPGHYVVTYFVYFSRLIFELIAAPAIKKLVRLLLSPVAGPIGRWATVHSLIRVGGKRKEESAEEKSPA
jgi:hypothetical protein